MSSDDLHTQPPQADDHVLAQFKRSLHELAVAVNDTLSLLSLPAQQVSPQALGARLVVLLTRLRAHRGDTRALGDAVGRPSDLVRYLHSLSNLRGSIAHWLTVRAAQPDLVYVEVADFEAQCWTTLGIGMVLLDAQSDGEGRLQDTVPERFHSWWKHTEISSGMLDA